MAASPELCFDLSLSVEVHIASGHRERVVGGVSSGVLGLGDEVTWSAWHLGFPWRMTSAISSHERPRLFVDEMKSGPFARWRHEHLFLAEDAGTVMLDRAEYSMPLGLIGRLVDRAFLGRYLEQLLVKRNEYIKALAESGPASGKAAPTMRSSNDGRRGGGGNPRGEP
jgi:ligand-binding SRPBCC domain-containing protein